MARVCFTPQLRRFTEAPEVDSLATTPRGDSRVHVLQALSGAERGRPSPPPA